MPCHALVAPTRNILSIRDMPRPTGPHRCAVDVPGSKQSNAAAYEPIPRSAFGAAKAVRLAPPSFQACEGGHLVRFRLKSLRFVVAARYGARVRRCSCVFLLCCKPFPKFTSRVTRVGLPKLNHETGGIVTRHFFRESNSLRQVAADRVICSKQE